jgi:hypothetical protein
MGLKQLRINGQVQEHDENKKIAELKRDAGLPMDELLVYEDGKNAEPMSDQDEVRYIPDNVEVTTQPNETRAFG